jgi:hypothetical protein
MDGRPDFRGQASPAVSAAADLLPRSVRMSSRKFRRIAVLVFALSFGAQLAQAGVLSRTSSTIQGELSLRTLIRAMRDVLHIFPVTKDDPPPPNNPGDDPHGPTNGNREGSAGCPLGPPRGGGPLPGPGH